jgi:hypothetical protein
VVTPTYLLFAILAFLAMMIVIAAMVVGPDTGHFAGVSI